MTHQHAAAKTVGATTCAGIHELVDWQILQFRQGVDAHRIRLSKQRRRCVDWKEAEADYVARNGDADLAERGRVQYCAMICPSRQSCLLALNFLRNHKVAPLYRAG